MVDKYAHFRTDSELRAGVLMWQIFSPILLVFGSFGNILSIVVLLRPRFRKWASTVYLIGLSVADLSVLYIGLLRQWVRYTFDEDIRDSSVFFCKVHWWLIYVAADCSVWILTAITAERLVSTLCPYKSKQVCTKRISVVTIVAVVVCSLLINCHLVYGFDRLEIQDGNTTKIIPCAPKNEAYEEFFDKAWSWIDLCKFSLIPFAILSSGNACILYKLLSSRRKVKTQVGPASDGSSKKGVASSMSLLLVALNFVFIICNAPVCVYFIGEPYWVPADVPRKVQLQDPWWAIVNMLMYINNSSNFVLYCVTGSRFRDTVKNLFLFRKIHSSFVPSANGTVHTQTT